MSAKASIQEPRGCRGVMRKVDRGTVMKFRKRFYHSGMRWLRSGKLNGAISPAFRERLMLAVTAVYGCRFCSYFHARQGLKSGIDGEEAAALLAGSLETCSTEEAVALLYAQHWAESNANPDPEAAERLERAYGAETAKAINLVLRMVRVGNLAGNLWDYFLYKLSRGKWGN